MEPSVQECRELMKLQEEQLRMIDRVTRSQTQHTLDLLERGLRLKREFGGQQAEGPASNAPVSLDTNPSPEDVDAAIDRILSDDDPLGLAGDDPSLRLET